MHSFKYFILLNNPMEATEKLSELFRKSNIKLVESGDHAVLAVMKFAKAKGKERVLIQNQGGWLTYKDYPKKEGLQVVELKTDYGIINLENLRENADEKSILLVNTLNGYFSEQPMKEIAEICAEKKCLLVNDASGSVGTDIASFGDIIICSFGRDKPVNLHYGGCIAYDNEEWSFFGEFEEEKMDELTAELDTLFAKLDFWEKITDKIKNDLKSHNVIHKDSRGINVVVKFHDEAEKEKIVKYCDENKYPYTLCPRYIRVNENAVSVEVKRLQEKKALSA